MSKEQTQVIKTSVEIGLLAEQLTPINQSYVLNSINALLFSQQVKEYDNKENVNEKTLCNHN